MLELAEALSNELLEQGVAPQVAAVRAQNEGRVAVRVDVGALSHMLDEVPRGSQRLQQALGGRRPGRGVLAVVAHPQLADARLGELGADVVESDRLGEERERGGACRVLDARSPHDHLSKGEVTGREDASRLGVGDGRPRGREGTQGAHAAPARRSEVAVTRPAGGRQVNTPSSLPARIPRKKR